jgi:uncharacterized protein (TIGR04255 family)
MNIMNLTKLAINIDESFQYLPRASIVEAVIDIQARPGVILEEATLKLQLESRLSGYQFLDSMKNLQIQHEVNLQGGASISPIIRELAWKGSRFQSGDKKHITQFNQDGFVFSRLEPYENWEQLYEEGMRLWSVYVELAQPVEVHRIGLRYINRIQLPPDELRFEDYLESAPMPPRGLDVPFHGFVHQDTLAIPGQSYAVNVVRTIQPPGTLDNQGMRLILDIDAFTTQGFELNEMALKQRLLEMRWLKNKVFFGSVTPNAIKLLQ